MTLHQALKLVERWHYRSLNTTEKRFLDAMLDGLSGLGDVNDLQVKDFLTDKQVDFGWKIAGRFLISKATKYRESQGVGEK